MSCESWQESIALGAGGNLSPAEAAELEHHLRRCARCRRFAEEMAASREALRRFHERPLSEASLARVRGRVMDRIAERGTARILRFPGGPRSARRWLALAASLAVAVTLWRLFAPPEEPRRDEVPPRSVASPRAVPSAATTPAVVASTMPIPPVEVPPELPPRLAANVFAANVFAAPERRAETRRESWAPFEVTASRRPLESSPSVLVLPISDRPPESSSSLIVLPASDAAPALPSGSGGAVLRQVSEGSDYTIYWLEEPADTLKEKEDAYTKVL